MSFPPHPLEIKPFVKYLNCLAIKQGFEDLQIFDSYILGIKGKKIFLDNPNVLFHLVLWFSEDKTFLAVHNLTITFDIGSDKSLTEPNIKILHGLDFLEHYAKKVATGKDISTTGSSVWVIQSAHELELFLEAYDNLAELAGCIPIFTR